jgi:hypothetical protein
MMEVIGMVAVNDMNSEILVAGYGKRSCDEYNYKCVGKVLKL